MHVATDASSPSSEDDEDDDDDPECVDIDADATGADPPTSALCVRSEEPPAAQKHTYVDFRFSSADKTGRCKRFSARLVFACPAGLFPWSKGFGTLVSSTLPPHATLTVRAAP